MSLKIGMVCFAENTGLGSQSLQSYTHLTPAKTMLLDRSGSRENQFFPERYGRDVTIVQSLPEMYEVDQFIEDLDLVLFFERPATNYFVFACRQAGVKTVVIPNFEYYQPFYEPNALHPDALIAPSLWRKDEYQDPVAYVPTPIEHQETRELPKIATNFLHIGGRPIHPDRNGTKTFLQALRLVEVPIKAIVTCQDAEYIREQTRALTLPDNVQLEIISTEVSDMAMVYKRSHVLVMPRRFGGQCMPVNEALGFGLPVIMPDIQPNNQWLPRDWLIPADKTDERTMGVTIDVFSADEQALADKITQLATDPGAYAAATQKAATLADNYLWDAMTPRFMRVFEQLCYS